VLAALVCVAALPMVAVAVELAVRRYLVPVLVPAVAAAALVAAAAMDTITTLPYPLEVKVVQAVEGLYALYGAMQVRSVHSLVLT